MSADSERLAKADAIRAALFFKDVEQLSPLHFGAGDRETARKVAHLLYGKSSTSTPFRTAIHYAVVCAIGAVSEMKKAT